VSPFIVIKEKYNNLSDIKGIFFNTWNLEKPKVMVSLTGAAASNKCDEWPKALRDKLVVLLERLYRATMKFDGWIIDGGSNAGCMRAMGDAINSSKFQGQVRKMKRKQKKFCMITIFLDLSLVIIVSPILFFLSRCTYYIF
jgi:hypothetical protein